MSDPTIVCILGMHRSGTSLVARLLHVLGVDLGPQEHLIGPRADNPTGYWESAFVKELNDEILERLGGSWSVPPELAAGWVDRPELADLPPRARELIEADFSGSDLWGFKDPRNSLTLAFWQRLLPPMRYLICLRNPLDVAASLARRQDDSVPFEQGIELWLTYARSALAATAGHPRQILFYEDLMADPAPLVDELASFIGLDPGAIQVDARAAIRVAMSDALWHHRTGIPNVVDTAGLAFHTKGLYLALRQSVPGSERIGGEVLDTLAAHAEAAAHRIATLEESQAELESVREHARSLERQRGGLERQRGGLERQRGGLERQRAALQKRLSQREAELERTRAELTKLRSPPADTEQSMAGGPDRSEAYRRIVDEVRTRAGELIPSGATVLVASKGDDALLQLNGSNTQHFPADPDGRYAGYHPSGDTAAIAQLETLRAEGADHLLLPATTLWWLDHYRGLRRHLESRYVRLLEDEHCVIYRLDTEGGTHPEGPIPTLRSAVASLRTRSGRDPSVLDWDSELDIARHLPEIPVFAPPTDGPVLPYIDRTIDIVVLSSDDPARIVEARRVATSAVIRFNPTSPARIEIEWVAADPRGWGKDVGVALVGDGLGRHWDTSVVALLETVGDGFAGALSVVSDREGLESARARAADARLRVTAIEVAPGARFADRASAAIEAAEQRVQVFVEAPALLLPNWLPSILGLLSPEQDSGVVGGRILAGDGTLKEAGGVLGPGGTRERLGEGDADPDRPRYRFVRRVDFCSPPLIATERDLLERLGGIGEEPVASGDAVLDFSLRAGRAGAPVYYQPQARVVALGTEGR